MQLPLNAVNAADAGNRVVLLVMRVQFEMMLFPPSMQEFTFLALPPLLLVLLVLLLFILASSIWLWWICAAVAILMLGI